MKLLEILIVALLVVGCGGAAKRQASPASVAPAPAPCAETPAGAPDSMDTRAANIDELWLEIDQWSTQLGIRTSAGAVPSPEETTCDDVARTEECTDTCTIADSICSNAEKICELADDLQERAAADKCDAAKQSCDRAKAACCKCVRS